jgi:DNA-binding GntR family transcriptional regulator
MRAALLGLASRRVAERATPDGLRELRAGLKTLEAVVADAPGYALASAAMVEIITRLSQNLQLVEYVAEATLRFRRYARLGLATQERRDESLASWRRLVRALAARDADIAESTHRRLALTNLAAGLAEIERREGKAKKAPKT